MSEYDLGNELADLEAAAKAEEAFAFCQQIEAAAGLWDELRELEFKARNSTESVVHKSRYESPGEMLISLPEGVPAFVKREHAVIGEQPGSFVATEVTSITSEGTEFYNRKTRLWLYLESHKFGCSPIPPPAESPETP